MVGYLIDESTAFNVSYILKPCIGTSSAKIKTCTFHYAEKKKYSLESSKKKYNRHSFNERCKNYKTLNTPNYFKYD